MGGDAEAASYAYCAKAWHLRHVLGKEPSRRATARQETGVCAHESHGIAVRRLAWLERRAIRLVAGLLVFAAALLARAPLAASRERTVMVRETIIGSAIAAVIAAFAVYLMLRWYRQRTGFEAARAGGGHIVASDTDVEPAALLRDPALGLCGRPDYLFQFEAAGRVSFVSTATRRLGEKAASTSC